MEGLMDRDAVVAFCEKYEVEDLSSGRVFEVPVGSFANAFGGESRRCALFQRVEAEKWRLCNTYGTIKGVEP